MLLLYVKVGLVDEWMGARRLDMDYPLASPVFRISLEPSRFEGLGFGRSISLTYICTLPLYHCLTIAAEEVAHQDRTAGSQAFVQSLENVEQDDLQLFRKASAEETYSS